MARARSLPSSSISSSVHAALFTAAACHAHFSHVPRHAPLDGCGYYTDQTMTLLHARRAPPPPQRDPRGQTELSLMLKWREVFKLYKPTYYCDEKPQLD